MLCPDEVAVDIRSDIIHFRPRFMQWWRDHPGIVIKWAVMHFPTYSVSGFEVSGLSEGDEVLSIMAWGKIEVAPVTTYRYDIAPSSTTEVDPRTRDHRRHRLYCIVNLGFS